LNAFFTIAATLDKFCTTQKMITLLRARRPPLRAHYRRACNSEAGEEVTENETKRTLALRSAGTTK
jgi:hypothetical protein